MIDIRTPNYPAQGVVAVTPGAGPIKADSFPSKYIIVDVAGTVTMTFVDGTSATFTLLAGTLYPFQVTHVTAATATGVKALY